MRYGSVCSGIAGCAAAWHSLGWETAFFAEIEQFPSAVIKHHYPTVPNAGDFTSIKGDEYGSIELLVGGTPCQDYSIAGLRAGMDGARGNLTLEYLRLLGRTRVRWFVWENVPGVLSSNSGKDFGRFLGGLAELGYGFAYRILDAQFFGVPQRRRRVFVVGHLGDWRLAAAVLFERDSLQGNPAPRRAQRQGITHELAPCIGASGRGFERAGDPRGQDCVVPISAAAFRMTEFGGYVGDGSASTVKERDWKDATDLVAHSLRADGFDASEDGTGRGTPLTIAMRMREGCDGGGKGPLLSEEQSLTLAAHTNDQTIFQAVAQPVRGNVYNNSDPAMEARMHIRHGMAVRRLTPRECERLQGFPDDYTLIPYNGKPAADGPRYKSLGNSWAVPVVRWIGNRIMQVEAIA